MAATGKPTKALLEHETPSADIALILTLLLSTKTAVANIPAKAASDPRP